jgi:hypothetical protein
VGLDGILFGEAVLEGADTARFGEAVVDGLYGSLTVQLFLIEEEAALERDLTVRGEFHDATSFLFDASIVQQKAVFVNRFEKIGFRVFFAFDASVKILHFQAKKFPKHLEENRVMCYNVKL